MPITISGPLQAALDDPERYAAVLMTFVLGPNTYGLWNGPGSVTYNTITYLNGGSAIEISDIDQNADGSVGSLKLKLNTAPDKGLTTDVIQTFYDEDWQFGHVTIQLGMRDPVTGEIIGVVTLINGVITDAPFTEGPSGAFIELEVTSKTIKLTETGGKYRNSSTQKALDLTDTSMEGIGSLGGAVEKELKWGQV